MDYVRVSHYALDGCLAASFLTEYSEAWESEQSVSGELQVILAWITIIDFSNIFLDF